MSSDMQVLRAPRAGVIDDIMIKNGDHISFGQPLVRLHEGQEAENLSLLRGKVLELEARKYRLLAQAGGQTVLSFPDDLVRAAPEAIFRETEIFRTWLAGFESQLRVLLRQKAENEEQVRDTGARIRDRKDITRLALQTRPSLKEKEKHKLDSAIDEQAAQIRELEDALARGMADVDSDAERIAELRAAVKNASQKELEETLDNIDDLSRDLARPRQGMRYVNVTSTVRGTIHSLHLYTRGGVVEAGTPIADIRPDDGQFVIEIYLDADADPESIKPGQQARVDIKAFDGSVYQNVSGTVIDLAPVRAGNDDKATIIWRVRVRLLQMEVRDRTGNVVNINPGMEAQADIKTGRISLMDIALRPFLKSSSAREG